MANIKISSLPLANALDGTEELPIVQAGTTKKVHIGSIQTSSQIQTGAIDFVQLTDVPSTYTGAALKGVRVNATETGLEFSTPTTTLADGDYGDIVVSSSGTVMTYDGIVPVNKGGTGQTTEAEALGEMTQALTEDTNPDFDTDYFPSYDASVDTGKKIKLITAMRKRLTADTTMYVRTTPATCTISTGSPAVVTAAVHGLSADDPVVFSMLSNRRACTISNANPGVITRNNHGFSIGDAICFRSTGTTPTALPCTIPAITANDRNYAHPTYYIIATGFTANSFQVSTTPGGAAISTLAGGQSGQHLVERARVIQVGTCTMASNPGVVTLTGHGLVANQPIIFASTGAIPGGVFAPYGQDWDLQYVKTVLGPDTFSVSATPGGAAFDLSGAQSGVHTCFRWSPFPVGIQEGQPYYVLSSGLTGGTFEFSATVNGAAVNTTGTSVGTLTYQTGNDANDGTAATRANAKLSIQGAWDHLKDSIDLAGNNMTIQLSDGTYYESTVNNLLIADQNIYTIPGGGWTGGGSVAILGNPNNDNVRIDQITDNGDCFSIDCTWDGTLEIGYLEFHNPSFASINNFGHKSTIFFHNLTFSGLCMDDSHVFVQGGNYCQVTSGINVLWGAGLTSNGFAGQIWELSDKSFIFSSQVTYRLYDSPLFLLSLVGSYGGSHYMDFGSTWVGTYTGQSWDSEGVDSTVEERFGAIPGTAGFALGHGELYIPSGGETGVEYTYTNKLVHDNVLVSASATSTSGILTLAGVESYIQSNATNVNPWVLSGTMFAGADGTSPGIAFGKSRGSTVGSYTVVASSDGTGGIWSYAADGTDMDSEVAIIRFYIDGAPGANDTPGRIELKTTPDGAATSVTRLVVKNDGGVILGTNSSSPGPGILRLQQTSLTPTAFGSLPTGVEGMLASVTNSSVNTFGAVIGGTGATKVLAYYNGANWTVAGV